MSSPLQKQNPQKRFTNLERWSARHEEDHAGEGALGPRIPAPEGGGAPEIASRPGTASRRCWRSVEESHGIDQARKGSGGLRSEEPGSPRCPAARPLIADYGMEADAIAATGIARR
jgi:hypothetical protein